MSEPVAPELRFDGHGGAWAVRELSELGSARAGFGFPESEQGGSHGIPFYKVSDMNLPENQGRMTRANNYVSPGQILSRGWRPIRDVPAIMFAKVGAAVFLGRKRFVDHPFLVDNNLIGYSLDCKQWDSHFARAVFESLDLSKLVQVGALPSFNPPAVEAMNVFVPAFHEEQRAIGALFSRLDSLIGLHRRKCERLQQTKLALMQRMFPRGDADEPELRCKGFRGAWGCQRLGEFDIKTGPFGSALHASDYVLDGTPIVTTEHFKTGWLPASGAAIPQVSDIDALRLSAYRLQEGDIVFSRVGSVDLNAFVTADQVGWLFSGRVLRVRPGGACDPAYLHYALETNPVRQSILSRAVGLTMPSINTKILSDTTVPMPKSRAEQQAIGATFSRLDDLISAERHYNDKLQQVRAGLLQKMFI